MGTPIEFLKDMIGAPAWPVPPIDWPRVESETGLILPADYKELVSLYPPLIFDHFLNVHHPGIPGVMNLQECAESTLEGAKMIRDEEDFDEIPYPLHPEKNGLYPWARTVNSDSVFWRTIGESNSWTIVVAGYSYQEGDWWEFKGTATEFLFGVVTRKVRCPVLVPSFPGPDPVISQCPPERLSWSYYES